MNIMNPVTIKISRQSKHICHIITDNEILCPLKNKHIVGNIYTYDEKGKLIKS